MLLVLQSEIKVKKKTDVKSYEYSHEASFDTKH